MKNVYKSAANFFTGMKESALIFSMILVILFFASLIFFFLLFIKKNSLPRTPVFFSAVIACLLSFPIPLAFQKIIRIKLSSSALRGKENAETLRNDDSVKLKIRNEELSRKITLLKAAQICAVQFERINELALIKTNIKQTKVWEENINDVKKHGIFLLKNYSNDVLLLVNVYDIDAKFGIDFNSIKVKKVNEESVIVAEINPLFIGASKNVKNTIVKEIRHYEYDENGERKNAVIKNDKDSLSLASKKAEELDREYQESLENMENWQFLNDAVKKMGENYVRLIFAPLYKNIEFTNLAQVDSMPMTEYIKSEIQKRVSEEGDSDSDKAKNESE